MAVHPGLLELPQALPPIVSPALRIMYDSSIAVKCLDGRPGQYGFHAADHVGVVIQPVVGVYAAYDMHFGDAFPLPFAGDLLDFVHRIVPRFGVVPPDAGRSRTGS